MTLFIVSFARCKCGDTGHVVIVYKPVVNQPNEVWCLKYCTSVAERVGVWNIPRAPVNNIHHSQANSHTSYTRHDKRSYPLHIINIFANFLHCKYGHYSRFDDWSISFHHEKWSRFYCGVWSFTICLTVACFVRHHWDQYCHLYQSDTILDPVGDEDAY